MLYPLDLRAGHPNRALAMSELRQPADVFLSLIGIESGWGQRKLGPLFVHKPWNVESSVILIAYLTLRGKIIQAENKLSLKTYQAVRTTMHPRNLAD